MTIKDYVMNILNTFAEEDTDYNITIIYQTISPPRERYDYILGYNEEIDNAEVKSVLTNFINSDEIEYAEYDDIEDTGNYLALIEFRFYI